MNQPYPPGGEEPYGAGGGPSYPAGGQQPSPPPYPPQYPAGGGQQYPGAQPYPGGQQYPGGQPYPGGWQAPGPSDWQAPAPSGWQPSVPPGWQASAPYGWQPPSGPPQSIQRAVMLMYVGAGLEVLGLIFDLIVRQGSNATGIPGAILGVALWLWMARANKAGKNWARITSTVFFGIDCLGLLLILVGAGVAMHSVSSSGKIVLVASVVAGIITWGIGLATIVLLWGRESSQYYAAMKRR